MLELRVNDKPYKLPENWQEVIKAGKYVPLMAALQLQGNAQQLRHLALLAITGIAADDLADGMMVATTLMDEVYPALDYIFKPEAFTECPIPSFTEFLESFYAPLDKLADQSAGEMEECGWAYAEYTKTQDEQYLNHLVAALYLPESEGNSMAKRHFDKNSVAARTKLFERLTPACKLGILLWYENCEHWWAEQNGNLYKKQSTAKDGEEIEPIDSLAISRLVRKLAGLVRGTVEDIRKTMRRDEIYFELQERERERIESER